MQEIKKNYQRFIIGLVKFTVSVVSKMVNKLIGEFNEVSKHVHDEEAFRLPMSPNHY